MLCVNHTVSPLHVGRVAHRLRHSSCPVIKHEVQSQVRQGMDLMYELSPRSFFPGLASCVGLINVWL